MMSASGQQDQRSSEMVRRVVSTERCARRGRGQPTSIAARARNGIPSRRTGAEGDGAAEHVVAVHEKGLAEEHPDRLASQHVLAGAYEAYGQVQKAVKLLEHVVAVKGRFLRDDHSSRLRSLAALIYFRAELGNRSPTDL
jgi:hypothetical protein